MKTWNHLEKFLFGAFLFWSAAGLIFTVLQISPASIARWPLPEWLGDFIRLCLQTGDPVQTNLSLRTLGINYEYSFIHRQRFELAATVGLNDTDISAQARVFTQTRHVDQKEDQAGPLPTIGLDSTYVLSKRFYLDGRAQYFKVAVDHLNGSLGFYELAGLYRLRPNISFALGYTMAKASLVSRQPKTSGRFDFDSKGPEFFVRIAF